MKEKMFRTLRKAALPAMLALTLAIPVGAMAARGGGHGFVGRGETRGVVRGGGYHRGGGVYFGLGAPYYGYGYAYPAPAPCGYYDQFGNWIATACAVAPY